MIRETSHIMILFGTYCPQPHWSWLRRGYYETADTCEWFTSNISMSDDLQPYVLWWTEVHQRYCNLLMTWSSDYKVDSYYRLLTSDWGGVLLYMAY
jgi:hypothetical protein